MPLLILLLVLYSTLFDWLIFKGEQFDWFLLALSEILLTACADQLLYNLSLIKLCSACAKQNATVKTVHC